MLENVDHFIARWFRIETFRQIVAMTILCTLFTTWVSVSVVGAALWHAPQFAFLFGVGIAAFIPIFITAPLAFIILYMLRLITRTVDQVSALIQFDPLTGALTRAHFLAETHRSHERDGVFMMVDADHFKKINDGFGHDVGDEVLKALASTLMASVGNSGLVGRLGGEEFGVYLPAITAEMAALVAQTIGQTIRIEGRMIAGCAVGLTVSIGAATHFAGRSLEETMKVADQLLYAAKRAGRDRAFIEGVTSMHAPDALSAA